MHCRAWAFYPVILALVYWHITVDLPSLNLFLSRTFSPIALATCEPSNGSLTGMQATKEREGLNAD